VTYEGFTVTQFVSCSGLSLLEHSSGWNNHRHSCTSGNICRCSRQISSGVEVLRVVPTGPSDIPRKPNVPHGQYLPLVVINQHLCVLFDLAINQLYESEMLTMTWAGRGSLSPPYAALVKPQPILNACIVCRAIHS
jgi:hypothetical protein